MFIFGPPALLFSGGCGYSAAADLIAVVVMASTISMMRWRAESAPMVMSVPQKSLSMEPTKPTMFRWLYFFAVSAVILPKKKENVSNACVCAGYA